MIEEKVFFVPGDKVIVKHTELDNRPVMLIKEKVEKTIRDKDGNMGSNFLGMRCLWFDKNQVLHEAIFSTKDLMHI